MFIFILYWVKINILNNSYIFCLILNCKKMQIFIFSRAMSNGFSHSQFDRSILRFHQSSLFSSASQRQKILLILAQKIGGICHPPSNLWISLCLDHYCCSHSRVCCPWHLYFNSDLISPVVFCFKWRNLEWDISIQTNRNWFNLLDGCLFRVGGTCHSLVG